MRIMKKELHCPTKTLILPDSVPLKEKLQDIRLIATDLDGTLLNHSLKLPTSLPRVLERLEDKGIVFATASGRNWATQKKLFPDLPDQISFICDNGAFLVQKQQPVFISELKPALWLDAANKCLLYGDDCRAVLCGVNGTYTLDYEKNPPLKRMLEHFYFGLTTVSDFSKIRDRIFKVSICYLPGTKGRFYQDFFDAYKDQANVLCTAECFMDIMNKGISKGTGLSFLQKQLGITPKETAVFGDFDNDISLFEQADHTFLMENAPLSMRQYARYLAPSNNDEGVTEVIKQYIL